MDFIPGNSAKILPSKFSLEVKNYQSPSETLRATWKNIHCHLGSVLHYFRLVVLQHKGGFPKQTKSKGIRNGKGI